MLALYEMQSASSFIWTRVAGFILYNNNYNTTSTILMRLPNPSTLSKMWYQVNF